MHAKCAGLKPACASALNPLVPLLLELGAGRGGEVATAMLPCPALRWHVCTHSRSEGFTRRLFATEPSGLRATAKGFSNKQGQPCVEPVEQDELCFDCEDVEVAHSAFLTAHRHSRPENVQVEGMQDFAAAIWDRRRSIPAAGDPLMRIFEAFDSDHDGRLNAKDVTAALRSRNVQITEDQAQLFIEAADIDSNHTVERNEFRSLITHMASADLWSRQLTEAASKSSSSESESEAESEEEVAQNEILQSILLESYEEVVIKQKQSESDG